VSKAQRDERLAQLQKAVEQWADKRTAQYKDRVAVNKAILKGRTGSERLADASVRDGSTLVVAAINDFLTI